MKIKFFNKIENCIIKKLNNYNLRKKMILLYVLAVLTPLIITDSIIFYVILNGEKINEQYEVENIASSVQFILQSKFDNSIDITTNIYLSKIMNEYLDESYLSHNHYFENYFSKMRDSLYKNYKGSENLTITFYTDNPTIVNGGDFLKMEKIENEQWYINFLDSPKKYFNYIYFDKVSFLEQNSRKKISIITSLDYFKDSKYKKIVKVDLNYDEIMKSLINSNYKNKIFVCKDNKIIFSNESSYSSNVDFEYFNMWDEVRLKKSFDYYDETFNILVLKKERNLANNMKKYVPLIFLLLAGNVLLPYLFVKLLNRSFTERLNILSKTFSKTNKETLVEISDVAGNDEISVLISDYNKMATRINELIEEVYKEEIKKQEIDIARQNAELLALHSQINPHFLFNALESIRMNSIIKKELDTADMIGALAKIQRKYVQWDNDNDKIEEEVAITKAYLDLQKNRFGNRLEFQVNVDDNCLKYKIPKLTLLTFVENSCVHGVEAKDSCVWIFIKIYEKENSIYIEVEDTGQGIKKEDQKFLLASMNSNNIANVKSRKNIGVANACLRLNMITMNETKYELESEEGVGTIITIKVPKKYL